MNRRIFTTALVATAGVSACQGDAAHALIGKKLPIVRGVFSDGEGFELTNIASPAIIRFWGMWCGPCMMDMPNWMSVIEQIRSKATHFADLNIITIHVGLPPSEGPSLRQWVASQTPKIATRVVDDGNFAIMKAVGVTGTPSTLYVDRGGVIREHSWQFKNERGVASFLRKVSALHAKG